MRLCKTIVSQQLSTSSAAAIWQRLEPLLKDGSYLKDTTSLREVGLSRQKIDYLQGFSDLDFGHLRTLDTQALRDCLLAYKGIGDWTVDMVLIFICGHLDAFSWRDLGLRRAAAMFYSLDEKKDLKELQAKIDRFKPYRSLAALILWHWYDKNR